MSVSGFPILLQERLNGLDALSGRRKLLSRRGVDFSSNDYLGFSRDPDFKKLVFSQIQDRLEVDSSEAESFPLGSSGSRLLRGHLPIFEETERALAHFCGREAALLFATGYQANLGLLSALLRPDDVVFSDQYNHASMIDGVRLSGARRKIYSHRNLKELRQLLESEVREFSSKNCLRVILTESVFSMDGDLAPLPKLAELAEEFSALLIVDEAHATGIWGGLDQNQQPLGGGWVQALGLSDRVFATVHPAGKAMGLGGAWICGDALLKEYLVNYSRPFIFSTAPLPILALGLKAAVEYWKKVGQKRSQMVLERASQLQDGLSSFVEHTPVPGLIIPFILGSNEKALGFAQQLQEVGFDIRAIRPPTVPEGKARLRITVNWYQSKEQTERLVLELARLSQRDDRVRPRVSS